MRLEHKFDVSADVETAWRLLLDLERVAPCLPGTQLTEKISDDHFRANVRVKVGPMQMTYRGDVAIRERDHAAHRAVFEARGAEARGQGRAEAEITATLRSSGTGTTAEIATELKLTGRVAQMGHKVVRNVSDRLLAEFTACLASRLDTSVASSASAT